MKRIISVCLVLIMGMGLIGFKSTTSNSKPGFIIITAGEKEAVQDFANFKQQEYQVRVVDVDSEIQNKSKGIDLPEQIRNWLKDNVSEQDKYLLLIGEPSNNNYTWNSTGGRLPMRIIYPVGKDWSWRVATDFYYADLDGDWDKNKNSIFGEYEDEINWKPQLTVGRIPTSDPTLVKNILKKIIENERKEKENLLSQKACICMPMKFWKGYPPDTGDWSIVGEQLKGLVEPVEVSTLYEKEGDYISSLTPTSPLTKENFEKNIKNSNIVITSGRERQIWWDKNSNKRVEEEEIQRQKLYDKNLKIENPITLFCSAQDWDADPLWQGNGLLNIFLDEKIIAGIGTTTAAWQAINWKNLYDGRYIQSLIFLFVSNLVTGDKISIADSLFRSFGQYHDLYIPLEKDDGFMFGVGFIGDPTFRIKIDTLPPQIKVASFPILTDQKKILVKGEVQDSSGIALLSINDELVEIQNNSFEKEITLEEGENEILIIAIDKVGNKAEMKILIVCDTLPPQVKVASLPSLTNQKEILLKGEVTDSSGIASLTINNEMVKIQNGSFEKELTLEEGENEILIIAIDKASNKKEMKIQVVCDTIPPEIVCFIPGKVYSEYLSIEGVIRDENTIKNFTINKKEIVLRENTFQYTLPLLEGNNVIVIEAEDNAGNKTTKSFNIEYIKRTIIRLQIGNKLMYVNDNPQEIDVVPQIVEGRTLLPIRWIAEPLGAEVGWDGNERKVTVTLKDTKIELWIGKNIAKVNGINTPIDSNNPKVVPMIINGRTMLPVRFIAENLGCKVDWDSNTRTVTITYPKG